MEANNINQLKQREEEIELTLKNLTEFIEIRNNVLSCFEKNVIAKTKKQIFSNFNVSSRGSMASGLTLIKKNYELDLKLLRRVLFYLQKRKRWLEEELNEIKDKLNQYRVDQVDPSQSA